MPSVLLFAATTAVLLGSTVFGCLFFKSKRSALRALKAPAVDGYILGNLPRLLKVEHNPLIEEWTRLYGHVFAYRVEFGVRSFSTCKFVLGLTGCVLILQLHTSLTFSLRRISRHYLIFSIIPMIIVSRLNYEII
jgi:hypothetical protein